MRTLPRYVRLYFLIVSQYVKSRMSYRADFVISSFSMVFMHLPGILGLAVILGKVPSVAGWSLPEMAFLYGFSLLAASPMQLVFDHLWGLRNEVQQGAFIKYYFRPINMLFYYVSEILDLKGFSQLALGVILVLWAGARIGVAWSAVKVLGLSALLLSGSLILIGLMLAAASTSFWIVNSMAVLNLISRFREYARYPLTIFSGPLRLVFTAVVPIGFLSYYPVQWVLRPGESTWIVYLGPLFGAAFFAFGYSVWRMGTRRWSGTGS